MQYSKVEKSEISNPRDKNITRRESGKQEIAAVDPVIKEDSGETVEFTVYKLGFNSSSIFRALHTNLGLIKLFSS